MPPSGYRPLPQRLTVLHPRHTIGVAIAIVIAADDKLIYQYNTAEDEDEIQGLADKDNINRFAGEVYVQVAGEGEVSERRKCRPARAEKIRYSTSLTSPCLYCFAGAG